MSQYDAAATPMYNAFQPTPSLAAFTHLDARVPLDEKNTPSAFGAAASARMDFAEADMAPERETERDHLAVGPRRRLADAGHRPQRVGPASIGPGGGRRRRPLARRAAREFTPAPRERHAVIASVPDADGMTACHQEPTMTSYNRRRDLDRIRMEYLEMPDLRLSAPRRGGSGASTSPSATSCSRRSCRKASCVGPPTAPSSAAAKGGRPASERTPRVYGHVTGAP